jgi:hypothetical protein
MVILVQLGFVVNRSEVGKAEAQPGAVKEDFDGVEDSGASLGAGWQSGDGRLPRTDRSYCRRISSKLRSN